MVDVQLEVRVIALLAGLGYAAEPAEPPGKPIERREEARWTALKNKPGSWQAWVDAANNARNVGKAWGRYKRLQKAAELGGDVAEELSKMDADYGRVRLKGSYRRIPSFERQGMPFAPDQVLAIQWAGYVIGRNGSFEGLLPVGSYTFGGLAFTVEAGPDWQDVKAPKKK